VVRSAARKAHHHPAHHHRAHHHRGHHHRGHHHAARQHKAHRWQHPDPSRATVRRIVIDTARRRGVDQNLALAVSWQESGWQMHHISSAQAIGAMQVLPSTGRWISGVLGRRLNLYGVHDNVTAGVVLLKILRDQAPQRRAIAGYYQGLGSVRAHGMYAETRRYVANVLALKHALQRGWNPA
jgi:soluble lytic murein transglycosylase-like protein